MWLRGCLMAMGVAAASTAVGADTDPRVAAGRQLFSEMNPRCTVCHSLEDKGNPNVPLDDVGSKWKVDEIKQWLRTPVDMAKKHGRTRKPAMVPYPELSDEELDALATFLSTLKKPR